MNSSDKEKFAFAIASLFETFSQETTKPIMNGYWLGLGDLSLEAVQGAVALAIRESDHLPRPAELRRLTGEQTKAEDRAIAAWGDVLKAIPLGAYKHLDFADKLVNATIRNLGGWPSFLSRFTDAEAEKWARIEFCKAYSSFASSGVNGEAIAPLPGLSEVTISASREIVPAVPVRIQCDANRAAAPRLLPSGSTSVERLAIGGLLSECR